MSYVMLLKLYTRYVPKLLLARLQAVDALQAVVHPASQLDPVVRAEPTSTVEVGSVLLDAVAQQQSVDPLRLDHLGGEVTEVAVDRPLDSRSMLRASVWTCDLGC